MNGSKTIAFPFGSRQNFRGELLNFQGVWEQFSLDDVTKTPPKIQKKNNIQQKNIWISIPGRCGSDLFLPKFMFCFLDTPNRSVRRDLLNFRVERLGGSCSFRWSRCGAMWHLWKTHAANPRCRPMRKAVKDTEKIYRNSLRSWVAGKQYVVDVSEILLLEEIRLTSWGWLQGFLHSRWCSISSINSILSMIFDNYIWWWWWWWCHIRCRCRRSCFL